MKQNKFYLAFLFFSMLCGKEYPGFSQIAINEVCPRNSTLIKDEDGDFEDWIEIFNSSALPVNLGSYYLSDDFSNLTKWQFPTFTLQPQQYYLVFASEKNRRLLVDHWETPVFAADQWRYKVPTSQPPANWHTTAFNDVTWNLGGGGIGYGDGDDNTLLSAPLYSVYMRRTFNMTDTSKISAAILSMDYDDGFVAYLNGVEIARANLGITGTETPYNQLAIKEGEAKFYQGQAMPEFNIDIDVFKSAIVNGTNVLAIQVHNFSNYSSDFSSIAYLHLGFNDNATYYLPTPSWFESGTTTLHTNFKLSGNGESIYLANAAQTVISQLTFPGLQNNNSYGCFPDGNTFTAYFENPTPDSTNNNSTAISGYTSNPVFSFDAGFYPSAKTISLSCATPSSSIRYTTDGSVPDINSTLYTNPLTIDSTRVIRVRTFSANTLPSEVLTNTYFINDSSTIPVFSISTKPADLFDWNTGMYMLGPDAETVNPFFNANFWQDWQIPAHIEFFDKQKNQGFEQGVGLEIQGNYSRANPQKGFKVMAKGDYGSPMIEYPFFPDKEIAEFKQIVLRNSGQDWNILNMRDAAIHKICQDKTRLDVMDYVPCLVYINGAYWGIYDIREKINQYYLASNHNVDPDSVDLLQLGGYLMEGNSENFLALTSFVNANSLTDSANYALMKTWLDFDNFIDYWVVETYADNGDWIPNNVRFWREQKQNAKWRYILWDVDFFGTNWWPFTANSLDTNMNKSYSFHSRLFKKLWENVEFRDQFINRYADLLNTIFTPDYLKKSFQELLDSVNPEMPRHYARWGQTFVDPDLGLPGRGNYQKWKTTNLTKMTTFINYRQAIARNQIEQLASLEKQVPVTFKVYPPGAGKIELNTIELDSFPWAGIYFDSVPITFRAIPNPGYEFAFWQSNSLVQNPDFSPMIKLNADTTDVFTAYFFGSPDTNRVCISEINYKSASNLDAGDWVELFNYGTVDVDLSGWKFKDDGFTNSFIFPDKTLLATNQYIVLSKDTIKFKTIHPGVNNFTGEFDFGLNSSGSNLRLFDNYGNLYTSMTYGTSSPWTVEPNGSGKTLELLDEYGSPDNPYNWFAGCQGGSPGTAFMACVLGEPEQLQALGGVLNLTNFPNPFNNSTTISFALGMEDFVRLIVIDVYGRQVFTLLDKKLGSGVHQVTFTPEKFSSGIYFYQVSTSYFSETKRMHLIR